MGRLARYFNMFMERLESYQRTLLEEIEKRREIQNASYENEQRLKTLVQNSPVMLWAIDRQGILTFYEGALPVPLDKWSNITVGQELKELWSQWEEVG